MLRFILTILKITGILLLVLVLLLLAVLLAIIFVPIRYRLQAVYTSWEMRGEIRITWLLHLLSVRLSVSETPSDTGPGNRTDEEPESLNSRLSKIRTFYEIRILGINLASALAFFRKIRASKKERHTAARGQSNQRRAGRKVKREKADGRREVQSNKAGKEKRSTAQVNESEKAKQSTAQVNESEKEKRSSAQVNESEKAKQSTAQANEAKEVKQGTERADEPDHSFSRDNALHGAGQSFSEETEDGGENAKKSGNLLYKLSEFCGTIKQIPSRLKSCYRQIRKMLQKPGQIQNRISKFVRKLEKYQASEVLTEAWHELGRLLHHYRVRKGSGYLRFGTGDPALTGEITGVLYMILPTECGDISIEPQFTETVFETELRISGHIRIVHLIRTAWWVFRNRKMRRLIRAFRK